MTNDGISCRRLLTGSAAQAPAHSASQTGVRACARCAGTRHVADAYAGGRRPPHQVEARHPRGRPHVPRGHGQGRCRCGGLRRRRQHPESEPAASEDARSQPHGRGDRRDPRPDGPGPNADVPRRQARRRTGIAAEGVRVREGDGRRYDCRAVQHGRSRASTDWRTSSASTSRCSPIRRGLPARSKSSRAAASGWVSGSTRVSGCRRASRRATAWQPSRTGSCT